jgi:type IV pilus assembly protein PilA
MGGTSNVALILVFILPVPFIGILAAIAIPAYQDYTIRAQVSEGMKLSAAAKAAVAERHQQRRRSEDREDAGMSPDPTDTRGKYVSSVEIHDGRIDILYGGEANSLIAGRGVCRSRRQRQAGRRRTHGRCLWRCGHDTGSD